MSVIQKIRNKYIGFVIVFIVIALVGFLVMDAMQSNVRSIFGSDQTLLADVNGHRVEYRNFEAMRQRFEENAKQRAQDGTLSDEERSQIMDQAWTEIVNETLVGDELEKLGIELTDAELRDMLTGPFADPMVQQSFTDPNTGIFDPNRVSQYLSQLGQDKTGQQRAQWAEFEEALIKARKASKYSDLITKGVYMPKFLVGHSAKLAGATASLSFVSIPYTSISDDQVKVSDDDIKQYMEKNRELFLTQDATAKVEYVAFDIIPSSEDTAASLGVLSQLKEEFVATTVNDEFVAKHSEESFVDKYFSEKSLEVPNPAEIMALPVGAVAGPMYMNGAYKLVKVIEKKIMPDSVKASHILIAITQERTEAQAKASIDSLESMVKAGTPIEMLAQTRSDDQGSAQKGGDLGYFTQGMMVPEFNDACFEGKTGDLKIVKSQYGYHLIKITDQKSFNPAVKVAVVLKGLQPGEATTQAAFALANDFMSKAKDASSFDNAAKEIKKDKRVADNITNIQQIIPGLGSAREVSRWAFDAKLNSVSPIISLDNKYIIAKLVNRQEKGTMTNIESVRPQIESIVRRNKKAEMIAEKAKGKSSLEALLALGADAVKRADSITYLGAANEALGYEPKVIGAAFNKANLNKLSEAIPGEQGVFFIKLESLMEGTAQDMNNPMVDMQRRQMERQLMSNSQNYISYILKKKANIEDNRFRFY